MEKVKLAEKFSLFADYWKPKIAGELNGQQVKLVKFLGPFVWHHHDAGDEMFLVVKGRYRASRHSASGSRRRIRSSRAASSTAPWRRKRFTSCYSSPRPR
jgi:mannose-6-phosphate isomerase-like protein (cupin superfamily)